MEDKQNNVGCLTVNMLHTHTHIQRQISHGVQRIKLQINVKLVAQSKWQNIKDKREDIKDMPDMHYKSISN